MTEQKVKKRGWVKNAAIIFLAVMLVLTFFSNTLMNRSLPEVAVANTESGTIETKIRGSGTVTAKESFEVKTNQTRTVLSVPVRVGDKVSVDDVLINFADADSTELKAAQDALDNALYDYKVSLLDAGNGSYAKEQRAITKAQTALDNAKADQLANAYSQTDYRATKVAYDEKNAQVKSQQLVVDALQNQLSTLDSGGDTSSIEQSISIKNQEIKSKENELSSIMLVQKVSYENFMKYATEWRNVDTGTKKAVEVYADALLKNFRAQLGGETAPDELTLPFTPSDSFSKDPITAVNGKSMADAYEAVKTCKDEIADLKADLSTLYNQLYSASGSPQYASVKSKLDKENATLSTLKKELTPLEIRFNTLDAKKSAYDTATDNVYANQDALEIALDALAQAQLSDKKLQLDLQKLKKAVSDRTKELSDLKAGGQDATVKSQVNGVVSNIAITAGNVASPDTALLTVEVPDRGYGLSFSVTKEQSSKLKVGQPADIERYWGASDITATLSAIKRDPQEPTKNKILEFTLSGEVDSGAQLSLSIGQNSGNYENIVPNSAIRTDNNGTFVLAVVTKSSPLGNRYVATRIDVKVVASDDNRSAVTGGLSYNEFVITTASKPVEPGMLVRLPD